MAFQNINNGESNLSVRTKINDQIYELYEKTNEAILALSDIASQLSSGTSGNQDNGYINIKQPPSPFIGCVGDNSTDDYEALQEILYSFDKIFIPDGNYIISKPLEISSNTHMVSGKGAIIKKYFITEYNEPWLFYSEGTYSGIVMEGLNLNLNELDSPDNACGIKFEGVASDISIVNCTFNDCSGAVYFKTPDEDGEKSKNIRISGCIVNTVALPSNPIFLVENGDNIAIDSNISDKGKGQAYFYHCTNSRIKNNIFLGADNYWGVTQHLGAIELYSACDNIDIEGNTVKSAESIESSCITAIRSKNSTNVFIRNNFITWNNDEEYAIDVRRDDDFDIIVSNHIISNNMITGTSTCGIVLKSVVELGEISNVKISDNIMLGKVIELYGTPTITDSSYNNIEITRNRCRSIFSFKFMNSDLKITDNTVSRTSNVAAIAVQYAIESVIMWNKVIGDGVELSNGIDYRYTSGIVVGGNIFKNVSNSYLSDSASGVKDLTSMDSAYYY